MTEEEKFKRDVIAANPTNLCIIFLGGVILILLWYFSIFSVEKYNHLALIFGIWMILWGFVVLNLRYKTFEKGLYIKLPHCVNCIIPYDRCEDGVFESITLVHLIGYIIVGMLVPDLYGEILLISILFEIFESVIGFTPKIILDPSINMLGYIIGNIIHYKLA